MASNHGHSAGGQPQVENYANAHHIVPAALLTKILLALVALTVLTVVTAKFVHLGALAVPVAFGIALVKALMVMGYFMGLKYDTKGNRIIFATGFMGLALLFFFCALDTFSRVLQSNTLF
ncbi:MAG: cytochrome C oxidase subunit IV family protein [Bdellovibrionaceae bacterium]|nr:cytochrome C oxidase subunit IV family protein [Pseudobdellovibrionaceae bacterium]